MTLFLWANISLPPNGISIGSSVLQGSPAYPVGYTDEGHRTYSVGISAFYARMVNIGVCRISMKVVLGTSAYRESIKG